MSGLIWAYEGLVEFGAYLSYMLGFSKNYSTLADAKKHNTTSKVIGNEIIENAYNLGVAPFIIAPITGGGVQGGQKTGVTIRDIVNVGDAYSSTVQAVYGVTPYEQVIKAILDLCGLTIVQNEAQVLKDIANGIAPGTGETWSEWWNNTAIKQGTTYVSNAIAQRMADTFSDLGYFDDIVGIKPGVTSGTTLETITDLENVNIIYACRQAASTWYSLDSQDVKQWRERGIAPSVMFQHALHGYNADEHSFSVCTMVSTGSNKVRFTIYGFDITEDMFPITLRTWTPSTGIEEYGSGFELISNTGAVINKPSFSSWCVADWYGANQTIEYTYGSEEVTGVSITPVIGNSYRNHSYSGGGLFSALCGTLLSVFTGSNDVTWKDEGYKVPTRASHTLIDIFPDLSSLAIDLPGIIGDVITAVKCIPVILSGTEILSATLPKVMSIDWDKVISLDKDEPIEPPGDPEPPVTPYIPDLPPIGVNANRLFTVHTIDDSNMNTLGSYLWSTTFSGLIEKMFSEPINAVLGLHELHYGGSISTGGNEEIVLGAFGSGAYGNRVTNRYLTFSCGSLNVPEFYGNVLDYSGYTTASIYLPYIGYQSLDINEIMGGSIEVTYGIDVYTGSCIARLFVSKNGGKNEIGNYYGQCGCQLPVTSNDYTNIITSVMRGVVGGVAVGGVGGAVIGGLTGAVGSKMNYGRSNGFNNNVAPMGKQKPVLVLQRPKSFYANGYSGFYGNPTNWTVVLSQCSGFTRVKDIHLDKLKATNEEKLEIEMLLKEGVIL